MKELITKNSNGKFSLTADGEQEVYSRTTRKLVEYYLQQALKKDKPVIAEKLNGLTAVIVNNFRTIDDYLNKIPVLARHIDETNLERFQKFMGQYFITTLQKEKEALIRNEGEKVREKLDNPLWTPSYFLLKKFENLFINASPLVFNPNIAASDTIDSPKPEPITAMISALDSVQVSVKTSAQTPSTVTQIPVATIRIPGKVFLEKYERNFISSPVLNINFARNDNGSENQEIPVNSDVTTNPGVKITQDSTVTKKDQYEKPLSNFLTNPPGVEFLRRYALKFEQCQRLDLTSDLEEHASPPGMTEKIYSLKSFVSTLNTISKFTKTGDTLGYQNWFKTLNNHQKAVIKINSLLNAEKKGTSVDWGKEIMLSSASLNENKQTIYQIASEIKLYAKIINMIKMLMHRLLASGHSQSEISSIYSQSIIILDSHEGVQEKRASLKILMLQITNEAERSKILAEYDKIINALK